MTRKASLQLQCLLLAVLTFTMISSQSDENTTAYTLTLTPSPSTLGVGFGYVGFEGPANCFRVNSSMVGSSTNRFAPFERIYSSESQCGGLLFGATRNTTTTTTDVNGTTSTNSTISVVTDAMVEMILIDPLAFAATDPVATLVKNTTWLRDYVATFVSWTAPTTSGSWSSSVEAAYYSRSFSGPLNWTNSLEPSSRFLSTAGSVKYGGLKPLAAFPMCLVGFLPVNETFPPDDASHVRLDDAYVTRGTFYFAASTENVSVISGDIASELQVQLNPRVSLQSNFSVAINISSVANGSTVNGSVIDLVGSPSYQYQRQLRTDSDWVTPADTTTNMRVMPPPVVVDGASWDAAVKVASPLGWTSTSNVVSDLNSSLWWTNESTLRVTSSSALKNTTSLFSTSRSLRCLGLTWGSVYANITTRPAMFQPTPLEDGSGFRNVSSGSFSDDNPCFPVMTSLGATNNGTNETTFTDSIRVCPLLGTQLLKGFFVCTSVPSSQAPEFEFAAAIGGSSQSPAASTAALTLATNITALVDAFLGASNNVGNINSNSTPFLMTSLFKWATVNGLRQLTPWTCFRHGELLMVPLLSNATPNTTLRPSTSPSSASLSATLATLLAWYRCANLVTVSTIRIATTPQDGYCGETWRVGLTGELLVSGLLLGYHNTPFVSLSTLYAATSVPLSLSATQRCCVESNLPEGATRTNVTFPNATSSCTSASIGTTTFNAGTTNYTMSKLANQTLVGRALRCSYDVFNVKRNCTPAVGAYMQLVLLPSTDFGTSLVDNHTLLHQYIDATPSSTSLTGLPLQLTNASGMASFPAAAPRQCFNDTIHVAVVFPTKGATDGTSVISDGAVVSYYSGITSFEYTTDLFAVVRPAPFVCSAGIRTTFVGGTLGVPLGPLDTDIEDSCGTLLSGLVSVRAVATGTAVTNSPVVVDISDAPLSSTLTGLLQRSTDVQSTNTTNWRAMFVAVVPMSNVSASNANANVRIGLQMRSRSLAAATDTVLTTDVNTVPFLSNLFLSSCVNPNFLYMRVPDSTADAVAPLLSSDCGSTSIPLTLADPLPSDPITVLVELATSPQVLTTDAFSAQDVWLNLTFSLSNFNITTVKTAAMFANYIYFTSDLDSRRAPRAFLYSVNEKSLTFFPVEIREQQMYDSQGNTVTTAVMMLPILVQPQSLYNNLLRETITITWSSNLFLTASTAASVQQSYIFSTNALTFTIHPNGRSLLGDAVTWINFLTMSGFVVRTGSIVSLYSATAVCFDDAGDRLSLVLHPLSFGIGGDETTQYLVGGVVGNACLIVVAFVAQLLVELLMFRTNSGEDSTFKGNIDVEDPDSSKGLKTFPKWGLITTSLLYPGVLYCAVRAVSLGLNTFLLYTIMLLLVLIGVGYPVMLIIAMRFYSPRWQENEAFTQKDVTTVTAVAPTESTVGGSPSKRMSSLYKNRLLSAKNAVVGTQLKVQGFFSKIFTPTGFYEVNHSDHVRFLASYQDYRGNGPLGNSIDAILNVTYAVASAFDCPQNQLVTLIGVVLHLFFLFAYRPYVTVGRVLCNVLVDIGCLIGVAIAYRGREHEGVLTLQCMMLLTSLLNIFGIIWAMWRSEGLRRWVRKQRKRSKKADRFYGRGEHFQSPHTKFLRSVEEYLFHLHSVKPQVVYRRNLRKRKLLLHTGNSLDALVVETASDTGTDDDRSSARSSQKSRGIGTTSSDPKVAAQPPVPLHRENSVSAPETPFAASILKSDGTPLLNSTGVSFVMDRPRSSTIDGEPKSPIKRTTSVAIPSGVSDEDSSDEEAKRKRNVIHLDAPDTMNDKSANIRRNAQNRFKPYLKTPDGRAFGRSDDQSVVKRLVIGPDGLREVREWREGTQQMANEEIRKRKVLEDEFMNITSSNLQTTVKSGSRRSNAKTLEEHEAAQHNESLIKRWEEAFRHEISKKAGGTTDAGDNGEFRESMFHRRQRAMGNTAPASFDFDRGMEMEEMPKKPPKL